MNVDLSIWDKLTRGVYFLLFVAGLLAVAVWYLPVIKQNERMRREILKQDELIVKKTEQRKQLTTSIESLRYDNKALARLARERLGLAKPGETVIRFEPPATNSTARQ